MGADLTDMKMIFVSSFAICLSQFSMADPGMT